MENYINHIKENKEYHMKKLFIDTFGGTTFKHLIEWFKSQKQGGEVRIFDFNLYPEISSQKIDGKIRGVERDWGYLLHLNKYRAFLRIYNKNKEKEAQEYKDYLSKKLSYHARQDRFFTAILYLNKIKNLEQHLEQQEENNYLQFKGINTDMFTTVDEYESCYNMENQARIPCSIFPKESNIKNGIVFKNDEERISFLENIYKELKIFLICGEKEYRPWKVNFYFEGSFTLDEKYFLEKND
jgi:hypothetical protein